MTDKNFDDPGPTLTQELMSMSAPYKIVLVAAIIVIGVTIYFHYLAFPNRLNGKAQR